MRGRDATRRSPTGNGHHLLRQDGVLKNNTTVCPSTSECEYPILQTAATVPMRGVRQRPTSPFLVDHNSSREVVTTSTGEPLFCSHTVQSNVSPTMESNTNSHMAGANPPATTPDLHITLEDSDPPRFRSASEPLNSPEETKPISITLGSIDYLVPLKDMHSHQIESCKGIRTEYANRQFGNSSKKSLNVDSPSFTPAQLPSGKKSTFSTNATPFTPRGAASCKKYGKFSS